jgi:hypothetical protein
MTHHTNGSIDTRSAILPTDAFDLALSNVTGHPNGAHTQPTVVQALDFYGNVTSFMVQTVKWEDGTTVFVTQVNATGSARFVLPPKVTAIIQRQQDAVSLMVRRRHGKRLAAERMASGVNPGAALLRPEVRKRALAARKAKAAARRARKDARVK